MPSGHVSSAYPLASSHSGRRRRMIAMYADMDWDVTPVEGESADVDVFEEASIDAATVDTTANVPPESSLPESAPQTATESDRIKELLDDTMPRTWVFTGDSLNFNSKQASRGWIEHLADFITHRLHRRNDIVLNSTVAGTTIKRLREDIEWRVLRFQPDVVSIMPSPDELFQSNSEEVPDNPLEELVRFLHDEGCIVVLCTPPFTPEADSASVEAADVIRQAARDADAFLVDHYDHWQKTLKRDGTLTPLLDPTGMYPAGKGHRKMARCLLRTLGVGAGKRPT